MLLAPAMKHIACSASEKDVRPAARRTIDVLSTMRAVATVRSISWKVTGCSFSSGVPSIATSALTARSAGQMSAESGPGNDSGASACEN